MAASITVVGLGPGQWSDLTLQAQTVLQEAEAREQTVYFRTLIHPTVTPLKSAMPNLNIASFDPLYDESDNWDSLYQQIAEEICALAAQQPVIYVVPGHPLIGETSVQRVLKLARERALSSSIVAGLSFLEPVCTALELDPLEAGTPNIDAPPFAPPPPREVNWESFLTHPPPFFPGFYHALATALETASHETY